MAKRKVIWSSKSKKTFKKILEFYDERNGSNTYSLKLLADIEKIISYLPENPEIGIKTDIAETIKYLIKGDYKIIYDIQLQTIEILMIWDCRQDPEKFKLDFDKP